MSRNGPRLRRLIVSAGLATRGALTSPSAITLLEWAARDEVAYAPGIRHFYSNNGYRMLAAVEKLYGKPYRQVLRDEISRPLGLASLGWCTALEALVPDLILQPLAENAIRHGIECDTGAGSLEVTVSRAGVSLVIEVRNSGRGPGDEVTDRIGLTTVRGRLAGLYPDAHEFSLVAGPAGGSVARIRIPFRTAGG